MIRLPQHTELVEKARDFLYKIGATDIQVLDGAHVGRGGLRAPVPDVVAVYKGKKVAVEVGYLTNEERFNQLMEAGYEIIIWLPKIETLLPEYRSGGENRPPGPV